jgi:hypothetical protein
MATSQREYQETMLELLPAQGDWSESNYLWLTGQTRRLVEYADSEIEVLPLLTAGHQWIVFFLGRRFCDWLAPQGG